MSSSRNVKHRHWLLSRRWKKIRRAVLCALCMVYVYIFYAWFVSPFSLRWKGIFGEVAYPSGYSIRGIDVSHHQGRIDWRKLRHARIGDEPVSFVFIKATQGCRMVDDRFQYNFSQARDNGFVRGAYHYFLPNEPADRQAQLFMNTVQLKDGDLPPVLDVEETGNLSPERLRHAVLTWMQLVEKHYGVKPILYTGYRFRTDYLFSKEFEPYPYWIAHYYVEELAYRGDWKFWQHTDGGHLEGIKGKVDLDVFNGSMYNLHQMTVKESGTRD